MLPVSSLLAVPFPPILRKKIPCVTFPSTETVKPDKENGIKLEAFIFDVFPLCAKMALFEVAREGRNTADV